MINLLYYCNMDVKLYVQSLCEQLDLIHFDVEPSLEATYSFNLYPSVDVLCQAFVDLIKKFEWKHTAIIYDSKTSKNLFHHQFFNHSIKFSKSRSKKSKMFARRSGPIDPKVRFNAKNSEL